MTGNRLIDFIILAISGIVGLATVGIFVYTQIIYQRPLPTELAEREKFMAEVRSQVYPESYKMPPLIINLTHESGSSRLRFIKLDLNIVTFSGSQKKILDEKIALVKDIVIDITSKMTPSELNSVAGKILLEDRLKRKINGDIGEPVVKEILFVNFVIQ